MIVWQCGPATRLHRTSFRLFQWLLSVCTQKNTLETLLRAPLREGTDEQLPLLVDVECPSKESRAGDEATRSLAWAL